MSIQILLRNTTVALMILIPFLRAFADTDPKCRTSDHVLLNENLVNPIGLKSYLDNNSFKLRTLDDLTCCLPKSYRSNYVIIHSSLSAQKSDVHRPRMLLYSPLKERNQLQDEKSLQSVISFNGGDDDLAQSNNIEMLYNNRQSRQAEFYDLDFASGRAHLSEKNPVSCMNCHGSSEKDYLGGAKPIFQPRNLWTRAIKGIQACTETERQLSRAVEKATQATINQNPRYKCLDQDEAQEEYLAERTSTLSPTTNTLDGALEAINSRRLAEIVSSTPDYDEFKYAILGALLCMTSDREQAGNFDGWFPKVVSDGFNDTNFLTPQVRASSSMSDTLRTYLERASQTDAAVTLAQRQQIQSIKSGKGVEPTFLEHCADAKNISSAVDDFKSVLSGPKLLDQFKTDSRLLAFRAEEPGGGALKGFNPFLRYLFEGRGIDIGGWSMDALHGEYKRSLGRSLAENLIDRETESSPIKKIVPKLQKSGLITAPVDLVNGRRVDPERAANEACATLKQLSLSARAPVAGPSDTPTNTVRRKGSQ